jgi:hypothetical protein
MVAPTRRHTSPYRRNENVPVGVPIPLHLMPRGRAPNAPRVSRVPRASSRSRSPQRVPSLITYSNSSSGSLSGSPHDSHHSSPHSSHHSSPRVGAPLSRRLFQPNGHENENNNPLQGLQGLPRLQEGGAKKKRTTTKGKKKRTTTKSKKRTTRK